MGHMDALSRGPFDEPNDTMGKVVKHLEVLTVKSESDRENAMYYSDPRLMELINLLKKEL